MLDKVEIRPVKTQDAASLIAFLKRLDADNDYLLRSDGEFQISLEEEISFIESILESQRDQMIVAEYEGEIIGSIGFTGNQYKKYRHQGSIGMGVDKRFWRNGIGRALLEKMAQWCREKGIIKISLEVVERNFPAIQLYKNFGFKVEGVLVKDFCLGEKEYLNSYRMAYFIR